MTGLIQHIKSLETPVFLTAHELKNNNGQVSLGERIGAGLVESVDKLEGTGLELGDIDNIAGKLQQTSNPIHLNQASPTLNEQEVVETRNLEKQEEGKEKEKGEGEVNQMSPTQRVKQSMMNFGTRLQDFGTGVQKGTEQLKDTLKGKMTDAVNKFTNKNEKSGGRRRKSNKKPKSRRSGRPARRKSNKRRP